MKRLPIIILLVTFLFVAVISKLIYIQVVSSEDIQAKALSQWFRDVPIEGTRGRIIDKNGVVLADCNTVYTIYARPNAIKNKEQTAITLSKILQIDLETVTKKLYLKASETTIAKKVDKQTMLMLFNSDLEGIYYAEAKERVYPYGDFLSAVIGFTNIDNDGQTGIEAYYNDYLKGIDGYLLVETDLVGREINGGKQKYISGKSGCEIQLTVDYYIQSFVENIVKKALVEHNAKHTSCIVMNVNTGEIVAIAESPSIDLNNVPRDNIIELFSNSKSTLVTNVFEPGSTFKIITSAIGLESGKISANTTCYCPGYRVIDGQRIKCWRSIGHGSQSFEDGVKNSCNCLFMDTALKIGIDKFYEALDNFGLLKKTYIDIMGESKGITIPYNSVKNVDLARMGFGQAVAVTPIGLLRAVACVINGGNLVTPYIVSDCINNDGKTVYKMHTTIEEQNVVSQETSNTMKKVLEKVVSEGSGKNAKIEGYSIGGKTGTAQKYENGTIARGKYISTFIGFTPADNPKYIALMIVDEPEGAYYGSVVAAPYIKELFCNVYNYEGIKPDTNIEEKEQMIMPNVVGLSMEEGIKVLNGNNLYYELDGDGGIIIHQIPAEGSYITKDSVVLISVDG